MILEKETYEKFGYYPSDLKPQSCKRLFATCDKCGKIRNIRRNSYRSLCISCAEKKRIGKNNPNWKGGKTKRICKECGKEFKIHPSAIKRGGGIFCSPKCFFQSEEYREQMREAIKHRKFPKHHTKPEQIFKEICKKYDLPFKYTGDNSFWIHNINPDFIECNGKKIVVEIFGDYWHSPLLNPKLREDRTLPHRKKTLKQYGWKLIVFWESDLKRSDAEQFVLLELSKYTFLPSFQ